MRPGEQQPHSQFPVVPPRQVDVPFTPGESAVHRGWIEGVAGIGQPLFVAGHLEFALRLAVADGVQAGADAIYIGAPAFGARQAAGNSLEDLAAVVNYVHTYGVQVLVTVNTLLREEEYPEALKMIYSLYEIGVDALIIQDLHLLDFDLPPIRLHASTQCDNQTQQQAISKHQSRFRINAIGSLTLTSSPSCAGLPLLPLPSVGG